MKIENIKKNGNNQYSITFEDKTKIKLYDDVILKSGLLYKKELSLQELENLEKENKKEVAYHQILNLLSKKMRTNKEIIDYLEKKEIDFLEQKTIIERLEKNRLLNDELYAKANIQDHLLLSNDGPNKIKDFLVKQNISEGIIDKYINDYPKEDIYNKAKKIILKKVKSNHNKSIFTLKQHVLLDMTNMGYDKSLVLDILDNISIDNNVNIVTKEYQKIKRKISTKFEGETLEKQIYYKLRSKGFSEAEIELIDK